MLSARAINIPTQSIKSNFTVNAAFRKQIIDNLDSFRVHRIKDTSKKRAAVAIVITNCYTKPGIADLDYCESQRQSAAFILTTRSARLNHHRSQRAFPGGRIDGDESAEQAALRELNEEIGLQINVGQILGRLDDYATRSGYIITPIVTWADKDPELTANPDEVESIHAIPVKELMRDDAPILESIPESVHPVLKMPLGNEWFAAPTAAIAYQFREVALMGKDTRVAHFEQPYFAWR